MNPLRQVNPDADPNVLHVSSLEGYGAPIIDISHLLVGSDLTQVIGTMRNFIPNRMVRATGVMPADEHRRRRHLHGRVRQRRAVLDPDQLRHGRQPGIEARVYGSEGAIICRLVEEDGVCERIWLATKDQVEFKRAEVPERFYPPGGSPSELSRTLFYANLISSFVGEILADDDANEGNFDDGASVYGDDQRRRAVVQGAPMGDAATGLTPPPPAAAVLDRFFEQFYRRQPVTATFTGLHQHDRRLPDWSAEGLASEADELRTLRRNLDAANRVADDRVTTFPDDVDLALADAHLEIALAEHESGHFVQRNPRSGPARRSSAC